MLRWLERNHGDIDASSGGSGSLCCGPIGFLLFFCITSL